MYKSVDSFGDKYSTIPHLWKIIFLLLWAEKYISISLENHAPADRAIKAKGKRQKFTRLWRGKIRPAGYFARITDLPG
jgi:hypothetical protein